MKRNRYAVILLVLLALLLGGAGLYVRSAAAGLRREIGDAYRIALAQDYEGARRAFAAAAQDTAARAPWLRLIIRRGLVDKVEETAATLADYATPDNAADLAVETDRVYTQLKQLEASFFGF